MTSHCPTAKRPVGASIERNFAMCNPINVPRSPPLTSTYGELFELGTAEFAPLPPDHRMSGRSACILRTALLLVILRASSGFMLGANGVHATSRLQCTARLLRRIWGASASDGAGDGTTRRGIRMASALSAEEMR